MKQISYIMICFWGLLTSFDSAAATAPRITPEMFDPTADSLTVLIYIPETEDKHTAKTHELLQALISEALKESEQSLVYEIYPSKTFTKHLFMRGKYLAAVMNPNEFSKSELVQLTVLPCFTGNTLSVSFIVNNANKHAAVLGKAYRTGLEKMKQTGKYDEIVKHFLSVKKRAH